MGSPSAKQEIDLHRRVCVVWEDRVDIKPARSAAVAPLLGLLLAAFAFAAVVVWLENMPFVLALLLMGGAILLVPFSGMGFVYAIYGANVIIDRKKGTAIWQQGLFGMGVGTSELVPFAKIERLEIEETSREPQSGGADDFAQFQISLLKTSGRRLSIGQVTVPRYAAEEGLARARAAAEAIVRLVDKPLHVVGDDGQPDKRRRRRPRANVEA
ncbi:MAG: hypothetical protein IH958_00860 [Chloroflexi bacterium]|nr:hypothetical protein [Chloroflexota bacterium]